MVVDNAGYVGQTLGDQFPYYDPYGDVAYPGNLVTRYGFTDEPTDSNGLRYLRARYYHPRLGVFPSLDPFEGTLDRPMSMNGYSYVEGNSGDAKCLG